MAAQLYIFWFFVSYCSTIFWHNFQLDLKSAVAAHRIQKVNEAIFDNIQIKGIKVFKDTDLPLEINPQTGKLSLADDDVLHRNCQLNSTFLITLNRKIYGIASQLE